MLRRPAAPLWTATDFQALRGRVAAELPATAAGLLAVVEQ